MRYIIIDTWNGEGYSESGIIEDVTYTDMTEDNAKYRALESAREHFSKRYIPSNYNHEVKVTYQQDALCVSDGDDDGAIHFRRVQDEDYGVIITPHVNDVSILNKSDWLECLDSLSKDGELLHNLESDNITFAEWVDDLYTEGNNDGHAQEYVILYKL